MFTEDFIVEVEIVQSIRGIELSLCGDAYVDEEGASVLLQLDENCNDKNIVREAKEQLKNELYVKFENSDMSPIYEIDL